MSSPMPKSIDPPQTSDDEGLVRFPGFFVGVIDDYRRRLKHLRSDYSDGFSVKTLSAALFMFFATFSMTVAFGTVVSDATNGAMGVSEYLLMNSVAGMVHALFGCQPLLVLRPTGPITAIIGLIYELSVRLGLAFFPCLAWTGIFVSVYTTIVAGFEMSRWIKHLTRFTHEIFAFFVCTICIKDGISGMAHRLDFASSYPTAAGSILASLFFIITFALALWLNSASSWKAFNTNIRSFLTDNAVTLSVTIAIALSYAFSSTSVEVPDSLSALLERVQVPDTLQPTCALVPGTGTDSADLECRSISAGQDLMARPWLVNLADTSLESVLFGAGTAIPIVFFFFMDQNVSSMLTQRRSMGLRKGSYYHSSMLWVAIFSLVGTLFGLPFVTGSLPNSPQLVKALQTTKPATAASSTSKGEGPEGAKETRVAENRIAPFLMYALIGLPLLFPRVIQVIPTAAINAILVFVGVAGLFQCELWERLLLLVRLPSSFPEDKRFCEVSWRKLHGYTMLQVVCLGVAWSVNLSPAGLLFSVIVVLLVPFRAYVVPRMNVWTTEELQLLDSADEDEQRAEGRDGALEDKTRSHSSSAPTSKGLDLEQGSSFVALEKARTIELVERAFATAAKAPTCSVVANAA